MIASIRNYGMDYIVVPYTIRRLPVNYRHDTGFGLLKKTHAMRTDLIICKILSIYLSIGINVRFAAMMADVGDGLL